ncbi:protein kinase domain-containing protein [Jatrophihabitans sp. YIM 134969]
MEEQFGPYVLQALIGRGGMGEVYRAFDTERGRTVALKVLPPELAVDETFKARFRRESRMAARLNEPHVIPIHDFGEVDGRLFLDMRLVEGVDLSTVVENEGTLAPAAAVEIVGQVAAALGAAHDSGLVHRDVKPNNVLVTGMDEERSGAFAYLVDFGIARALPGYGGTALTTTSQTVGTLAYMAPERISGDPGDHRADIYSLGCVLYECLTGKPPYLGETFQVMYAHVNHDVPSMRSARDDIPPALDDAFRQSVAKDPSERFQTTGQFARAMRAAVATLPIERVDVAAPPVTRRVIPPPPGSRRPRQDTGSATPAPPTTFGPTFPPAAAAGAAGRHAATDDPALSTVADVVAGAPVDAAAPATEEAAATATPTPAAEPQARPDTPLPQTPAQQTPLPQNPAQQTPLPQNPAQQTPLPQTPPQTPLPQTPSQQTPLPQTPLPQTPRPQTPLPQSPQQPRPQTPLPQQTPRPLHQTPVPQQHQTPRPQTPRPQTPRPQGAPQPNAPAANWGPSGQQAAPQRSTSWPPSFVGPGAPAGGSGRPPGGPSGPPPPGFGGPPADRGGRSRKPLVIGLIAAVVVVGGSLGIAAGAGAFGGNGGTPIPSLSTEAIGGNDFGTGSPTAGTSSSSSSSDTPSPTDTPTDYDTDAPTEDAAISTAEDFFIATDADDLDAALAIVCPEYRTDFEENLPDDEFSFTIDHDASSYDKTTVDDGARQLDYTLDVKLDSGTSSTLEYSLLLRNIGGDTYICGRTYEEKK